MFWPNRYLIYYHLRSHGIKCPLMARLKNLMLISMKQYDKHEDY